MTSPLHAFLYAVVLIPGLVFMFLKVGYAFLGKENRTMWSVLTLMYYLAYSEVDRFFNIGIGWWPSW